MSLTTREIIGALRAAEIVTRARLEVAVLEHDRIVTALNAVGGSPAKRRGRPRGTSRKARRGAKARA